jgi:sirohydrochlorin cobaltochelatase
MDYVLRSGGGKHAFVATVEGYPDFESVLARIQAEGYHQAALAPMMLVAGEHAKNDMSGDEPDSWKNICIRHGVQPRCILSGLGELPKIRRLYIEHVRDCINVESAL